jgi:predicted enzyme related to lactoylglutathione lyase
MSNADILGRFVWHELLTTDTAGAAAFYPKVLPWRTAPSSMPGYTVWMAGQTQIGGLMALPADNGGTPPHWLMYIGTPNVDATCAKASGLGAHVVKAPADIPNVGRFAVLTDPQGATFAVFTPGAGPPPGAPPAQGGFSWHELATTDPVAALRFYGEVFGWQKGPTHDMGTEGVGAYQLFEYGGTNAGGIYKLQGAGMPPNWLSYVQVGDCSRAVTAAKGAGGRVVNGPMEVPGGSWIAVLGDPQGGAFAVHEMPKVNTQPKPASLPPVAKPAAPKPAEAPKAASSPPSRAAAVKPAAAPKPVAAPKSAPAAKTAAPKKAAPKKAKKAVKKAARRAAKKAKKVVRKAVRTARRPAKKAAKKTGKPARRAAARKKSARRRR